MEKRISCEDKELYNLKILHKRAKCVACTTLQFNIPKETVMKLFLLTLCSLLSLGLAQDTYHCPDGWLLQEDTSGCRCFYFSAAEMVTRNDADALCAFHNGAWVAELDRPGEKIKPHFFSYSIRPKTNLDINQFLVTHPKLRSYEIMRR